MSASTMQFHRHTSSQKSLERQGPPRPRRSTCRPREGKGCRVVMGVPLTSSLPAESGGNKLSLETAYSRVGERIHCAFSFPSNQEQDGKAGEVRGLEDPRAWGPCRAWDPGTSWGKTHQSPRRPPIRSDRHLRVPHPSSAPQKERDRETAGYKDRTPLLVGTSKVCQGPVHLWRSSKQISSKQFFVGNFNQKTLQICTSTLLY